MPKAGFQRKMQKGFAWFGFVFLLLGTAALLGGAIALAVSGFNGPEARRGDEVVVRLDVLDPSAVAGQIDVTLRCTALYEVATTVNGNRTSQTREHAAHEDRREVNGAGPQEF